MIFMLKTNLEGRTRIEREERRGEEGFWPQREEDSEQIRCGFISSFFDPQQIVSVKGKFIQVNLLI